MSFLNARVSFTRMTEVPCIPEARTHPFSLGSDRLGIGRRLALGNDTIWDLSRSFLFLLLVLSASAPVPPSSKLLGHTGIISILAEVEWCLRVKKI